MSQLVSTVGPDPVYNVLILCHAASRHVGAIDDHLTALETLSRHRTVVVDAKASEFALETFDIFDAIVIHHSVVIAADNHLRPTLARRIAAFSGAKILFLQDEYRWIDRTAEQIKNLGICTVFTVVDSKLISTIYHHPWFANIRFVNTLTGFVPEHLKNRTVPPYAARECDVFYRARKVPAWYGVPAEQKWLIGHRFKTDATKYGLSCDISTREVDRLYGEAWISRLAAAKATLGTESAIGVLDYSGEIQAEAEAYERAHPETTAASIRSRFVPGRGRDVAIRVISPRCLEAAALRTLMILYPGDYSDVLEPHRHYVPLAPDHSNIDDVMAILRDPVRACAIVDRAYQEVACSDELAYQTHVRHFDTVLDRDLDSMRFSARLQPQRQELDREALRRRSARLARPSVIRTQLAMKLHRFEERFLDETARLLPGPISRALARLAASASNRVKPILKRLLLD